MADDLDSSDKNVLPSDETSSSDIFDADKTHSVLQDSAEDSQNQIDNSEKEASTDDVSSLSIEKTKAGDAHQKHAQKHDDDDKKKKPKKKRNTWWIKVSIISFVLAAFFSFLSELTADAEHIVVILLLLGFLVVASILFDSIGVAVTSCDDAPIIAMASRKIYGAKTAMWLVKNSGTVASICNDVIGDIFGIISGACSAAIVVKVAVGLEEDWQRWIAIGIAAVVSAVTIGGKAFMKNIAIKNSKEFVLFVARLLAFFVPEERRRYKKELEKKRQQKSEAEKSDNSQDNTLQADLKPSRKTKKNQD
ncbi:MAG: DUF21 domain-containing protein [Clostridia bacterium]|nr:DUF21 domain-containing protein [Clostridia bacterium]